MPVFQYEARDQSGQLKKDAIEAPNLRTATQKLQEMRYTVINITAYGYGASILAHDKAQRYLFFSFPEHYDLWCGTGLEQAWYAERP